MFAGNGFSARAAQLSMNAVELGVFVCPIDVYF